MLWRLLGHLRASKKDVIDNLSIYIHYICARCSPQQVTSDPKPPFCNPENVSHGYVNIKVIYNAYFSCQSSLAMCYWQKGSWKGCSSVFQPGVKIHYVDMGDGPPVLLCHGFPESWFSWRYQVRNINISSGCNLKSVYWCESAIGQWSTIRGGNPHTKKDKSVIVQLKPVQLWNYFKPFWISCFIINISQY